MSVSFFKRILKELPPYMLKPTNTVIQVAFSFLFAVFFLNMYVPFSQTSWFELGKSQYFYFTAGFILGALVILIVSRILLYHLSKYIQMNYLVYLIWCLVEITLIAAVYTWVTVDLVIPDFKDVSVIWTKASFSTLFALAIPYVITNMYFSIVDKNNTIRLLNFDNVVSDEVVKQDEKKITLFDNNGALKFSVSSSNLYYIESDDNYIKVWYTDNKKELKQYMLRCRLKAVEESFRDSQLVRCHRKYIVNMQKVAVLRKETDGYHLDLDNEQIQSLPVSKTYVENVLHVFTDERPLLEPIDESNF